jgi:hypothetical protein
MIGIFCNTTWFNRVWHIYCGKGQIRRNSSIQIPPELERTDDLKKDDSKIQYNVRDKARKLLKRIWLQFDYTNFSYLILLMLTCALVGVQIAFSHSLVKFEYIDHLKSKKYSKDICLNLTRYYMFEDLVYLPFSLIFLLILYNSLGSRRFNKYIMYKFKKYFDSTTFKNIQEEQKSIRLKEIRRKEEDLKNQTCGRCRYCSYKCFTQKFCSCFCLLFCCSCCVPPGSNTRCFLWYCCCLGWRQTDFYRILKNIWKVIYYIFYFLLLIPLWKALWNFTVMKKAEREEKRKKEREERRQKKRDEAKVKMGQDDVISTDIDQDDDFDIEDYDSEKQTLTNQCPFPSTPFSTSNRAQSAAVYIIYTYDVLNIFMTVYTGYVTPISLPLFGDLQSAGVLVLLVIQFLQVIMIGVKFYPILVVADADPNIFIYFISTIYMLFIWIFRFMKKSFCSRTDAFLALTINKMKTQLNDTFRQTFYRRYNASNIVLGLFSDHDNPNEKYMEAMKNLIPGVFKEYFGKYKTMDDDPRFNRYNNEEDYDTDMLLLSSDSQMGLTTPNSYYLYMSSSTTNQPLLTTTTTSMLNSTTSFGFRSELKNKTLSTFRSLKGFYYQRDEDFMNLIGVFENLPLYITLSFLLVRYGMLFIGCLLDKFRNGCYMPCKNLTSKSSSNFDDQNQNSSNKSGVKTFKVGATVLFADDQKLIRSISRSVSNKMTLEKALSQNDKKSIEFIRLLSNYEHSDSNQKEYDDLLKDLNIAYREKDALTDKIHEHQNHNYLYIKKLFNDYSLFDQTKQSSEVMKTRKIAISYIWNLINERFYCYVPHMKYSKQFINTYTVAFTVVYFFTLFGFRLSNIFGNALVGTIEIIYKFIFKGLLSSIDLDNHNFNAEFRTACLLTSLITFYQLASSISNFHNDLIKLHKGDKFFRVDTIRHSSKEYAKLIKERIRDSVTIASDSLHFPGYLIAHLVYGYFVLFVGFFFIIVIVKLIIHVNGFWGNAAHVFLPLIIMFAFKFVIIKFLIRSVFLKNDKQRITNLAPYFMLSYFNFFFDCFLGLVACMSRVWQTTLISLYRLPRLDRSMFNSENDVLLKRLDKGHLSYINYVRMEHWYNNPILNGFCEMLIESMFYSQIYKCKYDALAKTRFTIDNKNAYPINYQIIETKKKRSKSPHDSKKRSKSRSKSKDRRQRDEAIAGQKRVIAELAKPSQGRITVTQMISQTDSYREYNVIEKDVDVIPFSQIPSSYKKSLSSAAKKNIYVNELTGSIKNLAEEIIDQQPSMITMDQEQRSIIRNPSMITSDQLIKPENESFNYKSFIRLRNLICLCLLLRKNPSLVKYRMHYLMKAKEEEEKLNKYKVQSFSEFYNQTINKNYEKLKKKIIGKHKRQHSN